MQENKPSPLISLSKFISNFFNPLTSLVIFFIYQSTKTYTYEEALKIFIPILCIIIIPVSGWIAWNVKKGKYSNVDVSNRNQRKSLYFFIGGVILLYLIYGYIRYQTMDYIMLYIFVLLIIMQISNYFIKSSMHTAFNVLVAGLFFHESWIWGLVWMVISIVVGITRIILKRHTIQEVLMGAGIALLVSFMYLYGYNL